MTILKSREAILALAIVILLALIVTRFPAFIAPRNLASVFTDTSPLIILALGQMAVILNQFEQLEHYQLLKSLLLQYQY